MTIKTLKFIHTLLIEREQQTGEAYRNARKIQAEYAESETAPNELIKRQTEVANRHMAEHLKAVDALTEFENQEW